MLLYYSLGGIKLLHLNFPALSLSPTTIQTFSKHPELPKCVHCKDFSPALKLTTDKGEMSQDTTGSLHYLACLQDPFATTNS